MNETETAAAKPRRRWVKWLVRGLLVFCAALLLGIAAAGFEVWSFVRRAIDAAPPLEDVTPKRYRTSVLDRNGAEILVLAGEESNRVYVTLDRIPKHLQDAFIAIEDQRFYEHHGVDLQGIFRAAVKDLTTGTLAQGASTITQQLIKNSTFRAGMEERTAEEKIVRKLQEQYLALELEKTISKEMILENYLNTINLGGGTWGVQTAAMRYFGKDVSELTLAESAAIAAVTRNPTAYNPLTHPEENRERQRLVLSSMLELGLISQEDYDRAVAEDIYTDMEETAVALEIPIFSWFEDAALQQVVEDMQSQLGWTSDAAWDALYQGGLVVETTLDPALQAICEEEANRPETDAQATVVVMEPSSGEVRAIVGGRGEKTASLTLNRAVSSPRQPGSAIKIIGEYAAALDLGDATLATVFDDAPTYYTSGLPIRNATEGYRGRTPVRCAIAHSLNTVALQCFQEVGVDLVWDRLHRFGLTHLDPEDQVEALALGGTHGGVTNVELTAAYAAIANGGVYVEPHFYTRVLDRDGSVLMEKAPDTWAAVRPATAALLISAMEDVLASGTGRAAAFPGQELAGKSGTATDRRDLWFVGFSTSLACGVWTGYDTPAPQEYSGSFVQGIWKAVMERAHGDLPAGHFAALDALERRVVCAKCGKLAVDGLCEASVQGDMAVSELFDPEAVPEEPCGCHVRVEVCRDSGKLAGRYCPNKVTRVMLYLGTPGTPDEDAMAPEGKCTLHQSWEERFFRRSEETTPSAPRTLPTPWSRQLW